MGSAVIGKRSRCHVTRTTCRALRVACSSMRRRDGDGRAPVASRSVRVPPPREAEQPRVAPRRGPARAQPEYSSESEDDDGSYSSEESEESRRAPPPPPPRGGMRPALKPRAAQPPPAQRPAPATSSAACSSLFPASRPARCAPPLEVRRTRKESRCDVAAAPLLSPARVCALTSRLATQEIIDRALVPEADSNAARIAAELARRYPQARPNACNSTPAALASALLRPRVCRAD